MIRRSRLLAAVAACLLAATACSTGNDAVDQSAGGQFRFVGATAKGTTIPANDRKTAGDMHGTLLDGGSFQLSTDRGKVVVINYWASWCGPCVAETPQLDALYREVKPKGIQFVGVDTKDEQSAAQAFVTDNHISYPIVFDQNAQTALQLGKVPALSLPFTVVIDKAQRVAAVYVGSVLPADLQPVLTSLNAES